MAKTIKQKVVFKNAKAKDVYDAYMNAKKHSHVTGAPAKISNKEGTDYSAHNEYIKGKNLRLIKDKLIVQTWRASAWKDIDMDSTFIIHLEQKGKDVVLEMIHANVPDSEVEGLTKGWNHHYWGPMKSYLAGKPIKRVTM
ncbi:MAG TPA: SRPBCC domain-containing protein [Chitinophagales bacterium]|nr:SRPBCC domain-containing protein [Chitinophagales bacterium]